MIILDTNVVPNGPAAGNVVFPILQVVAEHSGQRLAVPTIVVEESCERLRRELLEAHEQILRGVETTRKYLGANAAFHPRPIDDLVVPNWRDYLDSIFEVIDAPASAYEEAILREVRRRPPAREGRGARDALVWLTVLSRQAEGETNYFVSNNAKDFGKTDLLPSLQAEMPNESKLIYCSSLADLLGRLATKKSELRIEDVESSAAVREAIGESLTGPPRFFEVFALASIEFQGRFFSASGVDVVRIALEDSAVYEIGANRFAGARCRVVTRHHISATSVEEGAASDRLTQALEIETQPLLFAQLDEEGAITQAQVIQQTQPLRLATSK